MARKPLPIISDPEQEESQEEIQEASQDQGESQEEIQEGSQDQGESQEGQDQVKEQKSSGIWLLAKFNEFYNPYTEERFRLGIPKECFRLDSLTQCQIDAGLLVVVDPPVQG